MARPSKPVSVIKSEGKSHRTKAELEARQAAERSLLSTQHIYERKEVKADKVAHTEFIRLRKLFKAIDKDDALYSSAINTYCQLYSEISYLREETKLIEETAVLLKESFSELKQRQELSFEDVIAFEGAYSRLISKRLNISATIDKKRKMMLDIDKENVMTISASLRVIPKQPEKKENPLLAALSEE